MKCIIWTELYSSLYGRCTHGSLRFLSFGSWDVSAPDFFAQSRQSALNGKINNVHRWPSWFSHYLRGQIIQKHLGFMLSHRKDEGRGNCRSFLSVQWSWLPKSRSFSTCSSPPPSQKSARKGSYTSFLVRRVCLKTSICPINIYWVSIICQSLGWGLG